MHGRRPGSGCLQSNGGSIRHFEALGAGAGWRCLEIGAGGGSVAAWLCDRADPEGYVLATDLDPRFVEALELPNLEARRHDITVDPIPADTFDLAHARLLVAHLSDRAGGLDRMVGALKPGGWMLLEEMGFGTVAVDPEVGPEAVGVFDRAIAAHHRVMAKHGFDPFYGRRLFRELRVRGMEETGAEGRISSWTGGSAGATAWRLTFEQIGEEMVETSELSAADLAATIALFDDPRVEFLSQATVAAWGRRPA